MIAAELVASPGELVTSWKETRQRYPDQYVVLVETDWIKDVPHEFRSARVIGHGPMLRDAIANAAPLQPLWKSAGYFWTGPIRAPIPRTFVPRPR